VGIAVLDSSLGGIVEEGTWGFRIGQLDTMVGTEASDIVVVKHIVEALGIAVVAFRHFGYCTSLIFYN
jgi:hypothetical protein